MAQAPVRAAVFRLPVQQWGSIEEPLARRIAVPNLARRIRKRKYTKTSLALPCTNLNNDFLSRFSTWRHGTPRYTGNNQLATSAQNSTPSAGCRGAVHFGLRCKTSSVGAAK